MILLLLEPKRITIKLYMDIGENILENKTHCCNWALYLHSTGLLKVVIDVSLGCDLSR